MPPSPTLVILRGVCDVGVTSPSLLLSLDSLRLGLRGRRRRRFSDPDDSGEVPREDGVGVRGPDLGGAPFPAGPSSVLTGIASPTGPESPESFVSEVLFFLKFTIDFTMSTIALHYCVATGPNVVKFILTGIEDNNKKKS